MAVTAQLGVSKGIVCRQMVLSAVPGITHVLGGWRKVRSLMDSGVRGRAGRTWLDLISRKLCGYVHSLEP